MPPEPTIFVLDRLVAKPGRGQDLYDRYMRDYVPWATARGLTLRHRWISPPVWLHAQSNVVTMVWSVDGVAGYWAVEQQVRWDPDTSAFWRDIAPLIDSRTRSVSADACDIEVLADV